MANDTVSPGPVARFLELPESPLLTLNMITPESWMVQAVRSPHDLDNIHLQEVYCSFVTATGNRVILIPQLGQRRFLLTVPTLFFCPL